MLLKSQLEESRRGETRGKGQRGCHTRSWKGLGEAARKKEEKKRKGKKQGSLLPAKPVGEEDLKLRDGKQPPGLGRKRGHMRKGLCTCRYQAAEPESTFPV